MRKQELSKLIYFLAALDVAERAHLRDYLHSPVFNQKVEPRLLYDYILEHCLKRNIQEMEDDKAVQAVWPDGKGDLARLQKLKSALMNLYLSFLEFQHWQSTPVRSKAGLLHRLNDIHDESYFELYYRKIKAELPKLPQQDMDTFSAELDIEMARLRHKLANGIRSNENHLDIAAKAMEKVVQGQVLKFAFLIANQRHIVGAKMPAWIQAYMANLQYADVEGEPLLEIYFLLFFTMDAQTELDQLNLLKDKLLLHASRWSKHVAENLYTGTLNNFARFSQRTGKNLLGPIFELYQSMVETLYRNGAEKLNRSHFKNIVLIGTRLGQFEWVTEFISEAKYWLEDDNPDTTIAYNTGVLHFYQKDFISAKRFFNRALTDVSDVFYEYDGRLFLLMCYYETHDTLGMESLVHSFRMLLGRSGRVSEKHKKIYTDLIRLFRKMLGIPPNDQFRLQQLKTEIERLPMSPGKSWLLEKVEVAG